MARLHGIRSRRKASRGVRTERCGSGPEPATVSSDAAQHPDRPGVVGTRFAGVLCGTPAPSSAGSAFRGPAADRRRPREPQSLRPHGSRDPAAARPRAPTSRLHGPREHEVSDAAGRPRRARPRLVGVGAPGAVVTVTAVPARHFSPRWLFDRTGPWCGYVVQGPSCPLLARYGWGFSLREDRPRFRICSSRSCRSALPARWFMASAHIDPMSSVRAHETRSRHVDRHPLRISPGEPAIGRSRVSAPRARLGSPPRFLLLDNGESFQSLSRPRRLIIRGCATPASISLSTPASSRRGRSLRDASRLHENTDAITSSRSRRRPDQDVSQGGTRDLRARCCGDATIF